MITEFCKRDILTNYFNLKMTADYSLLSKCKLMTNEKSINFFLYLYFISLHFTSFVMNCNTILNSIFSSWQNVIQKFSLKIRYPFQSQDNTFIMSTDTHTPDVQHSLKFKSDHFNKAYTYVTCLYLCTTTVSFPKNYPVLLQTMNASLVQYLYHG